MLKDLVGDAFATSPVMHGLGQRTVDQLINSVTDRTIQILQGRKSQAETPSRYSAAELAVLLQQIADDDPREPGQSSKGYGFELRSRAEQASSSYA